MNKYSAYLNDIFSIFATTAWKNENIKTYPDNYIQVNAGQEFVRVHSLLSGTDQNNIMSGILIAEIFIPAGSGPSRAYSIADKLDNYLAGKTIATALNGNTQLFSSSLATLGADPINKGLHRYKYTIPFNYFGVK